MSYEIEVVRCQEQTTSNWSGGTTTQIAIYPKDAVYSERNFQWRLSSARVETEKSEFTSLPGVRRLIMVLEGTMRLEHAGHHTVTLAPFEQDSFSGDWTTTSFGKVRDFNVMLTGTCAGELTAIHTNADRPLALETKPGDPARFAKVSSAFYCVSGSITLTIDNKESYELLAGDFLLLTLPAAAEKIPVTLAGSSSAPAHIVRADIKYC